MDKEKNVSEEKITEKKVKRTKFPSFVHPSALGNKPAGRNIGVPDYDPKKDSGKEGGK